MLNRPGVLLRLEGAAVCALAVFFYWNIGGQWWLFLVLFLWPDLFLLGYLASPRVGSALYNLAHTYALPLTLVVASYGTRKPGLLIFALIWLAHIGVDRALGFGLKYPTAFKDTHLQRVGMNA